MLNTGGDLHRFKIAPARISQQSAAAPREEYRSTEYTPGGHPVTVVNEHQPGCGSLLRPHAVPCDCAAAQPAPLLGPSAEQEAALQRLHDNERDLGIDDWSPCQERNTSELRPTGNAVGPEADAGHGNRQSTKASGVIAPKPTAADAGAMTAPTAAPLPLPERLTDAADDLRHHVPSPAGRDRLYALLREAAAALAQLPDTTEFDNACKTMARFDRKRDGAVSLSQAIEELAESHAPPREPDQRMQEAMIAAMFDTDKSDARRKEFYKIVRKGWRAGYDAAPAGIPRDDARDAARYRWLREDNATEFGHPWTVTRYDKFEEPTSIDGPALDAAIDAALHEPTPTEQPGTAGQPKRYRLCAQADGGCAMEPDPNGEWIAYGARGNRPEGAQGCR